MNNLEELYKQIEKQSWTKLRETTKASIKVGYNVWYANWLAESLNKTLLNK